MTRSAFISGLKRRLGLSVFALGLSAFSALSSATTAVADDDPTAPAPEAVQAQADDLRQLFEAASRDGLVQLREKPATLTGTTGRNPEQDRAPSKPYSPPRGAADCMQLAPLFDGGQGGFEDGLFTELMTDAPDHAPLAETLAQLIDIAYDGEPVPVDLSSAGNCGSSFLPWQALAAPGKVLDAEMEARLATALGRFKPALRRQIGVHIAIRAGLSDNLRLSRRISDTLTDEGFHGTPRHDADIEHVLLDAILKIGRDPIGARARLEWVSDRDGPEQSIALDLLETLDASEVVQSDLTRMTDSPILDVAESAQKRLLANAIRDQDMGQLSTLLPAGDDLADDPASKSRLSETLTIAIMDDDPLKAIMALDLYKRLDENGIPFDAAFRATAAARLETLRTSSGPATAETFASTLPPSETPTELTGPEVTGYIGSISDDLSRYQEVLDRG